MRTIPFADPDGALAHLNNFKDNINHVHLVKNYQDGDTYATVTGAKSVANIAITAPDMGITDESGDKVLTINGKNGLNKTQNSDQHALGTATAGSNTTLTDTGANFTGLENKVVHIKAGAGAGKSAIISSVTATQLTFADIGVALDNTSEYEILDDLVVVFVDTVNEKIKLAYEETTDQAINAAGPNSVNIGMVQQRVKVASAAH